MDFSKDSENMIYFLMKHFKSFNIKKTAKEQAIYANMFTKFYTNINIANHKIGKMWDTRQIKRNIYEIDTELYMHSNILDSVWVPENIKRYIKTNTSGRIHYRGLIKNKNIDITLYLVEDKQFNELSKLDALVRKMFVWLYFIISYSSKSCSKYLHIHCYLCPHKKILPTMHFKALGPNNINSGVSDICPIKGEICIFRKEEMFKVFLHETFHAFGLDWSEHNAHTLTSKLKNLFPISSNMNAAESYAEFWAVIFNCLFNAYYQYSNDVDEYLVYAEYCIHFEQMFTLFQCVKILQFMGLYYSTLYKKDDFSKKARKILYKERSNVFTYFFLKMILLLNAEAFLLWCERNNTNIVKFTMTEHTFNAFYTFIKKHYASKNVLKNLAKMHKILKSSKDKTILNNSRMTVIEWN